MPIQLLSDQLASQIAAGEVVERPFSVVKELVENAIDAGATTINVDVRDGGRTLIQVADNGSGIPAADIETAFLRHATSKLTAVEDLNAIATLGFRGEALAAIAAVSQLTIVSRAESEQAGTRLVLAGGKVTSRDVMGAAQGTVIAVENLFYNTPARLKFLKSVTSEKRLIDEFVSRYALAYPHIRFRLTHNGRITFQTNGAGDLLDVLVEVYGIETARELLPLAEGQESGGAEENEREILSAPRSVRSSADKKQITVAGYVGPPSLHWANRSHITLFVNGRWIKDNAITYAVIQAYHTLLPTGRYPLGIVFIEMPPDQVDVNVHPTKTEVRFRQANAVFGAVQKTVRTVLVESSPIRSVGGWAASGQPAPSAPGWGGSLDDQARWQQGEDGQAVLGLDWSAAWESDTNVGNGASEPVAQPPLPDTGPLGGDKLPIMRVVGQVGAAYIITEGPDGMFLIDQHAAHERILYEQFMAAWNEDEIVSQGLVAGTAVHLTPDQATLLADNLDTLARIGFTVEPFGPNAFMIRAIPAILAKKDPAQALMTVVEDLERGDKPLQGKIEEKIILRVCKTAAVKAGQTLSPQEMDAMIHQLEACASPHTCPHGRPTMIHLSVAQLAREFGRI